MKTAVEWLIDEHFGGIENCTPDFRFHIQQALEMEKEHMVEAWENGKKSTQCKSPICERKTGLGYYNKTFKQEQ